MSSVQRAIEAGRVVVVEEAGQRKIDVAASDKAWSERTRPKADAPPPARGRARAAAPAADQGDELPLEDGESYSGRRSAHEAVRLELSRLELARKRGELLEAADVERDNFAIYRHVRDRLLAVPARVAAQAQAAASIREAELAIEAEIRAALEELADAVTPKA